MYYSLRPKISVHYRLFLFNLIKFRQKNYKNLVVHVKFFFVQPDQTLTKDLQKFSYPCEILKIVIDSIINIASMVEISLPKI